MVRLSTIGILFLVALGSTLRAQDDAPSKRAVFQRADSLFKAGIAAYEKRNAQGAIDSWNAALPLFQSLNERKAELMIVGNLALAYRVTKQIDLYRQTLDRQVQLASELDDHKTEAAALTAIGHVLVADFKYEDARQIFLRALAIQETAGNKKEEAYLSARIAAIYQRSSEYRQSMPWYRRAMAGHETLKMSGELSDDLIGLGSSYRSLGLYDSAKVLFSRALDLKEMLKDEDGTAEVFSNLGIVHDFLGEFDLAEKYYRESLTLYSKVRNERGMADANLNLGVLYHNRGDYQNAMDSYQTALKIHTKLNTRQSMAKALANIAVIHRDLNQLDESLRLLTQAIDIEKSINDKQGLASHLSIIGSIYWKKNDVSRASDYLEQSIAIKREIGDQRGESNDLISFGWIQLRQIEDGHIENPEGRYPLILQTFEKAYGIKSSLGDIYGEITALTYLGQTSRLMKNFEQARTTYNKALQLAQSKRAETLIWQIRYGIAKTLEKQGLLNEAIAEIRSAVDLVENQRGTLKSEEFRLGYFQDKSFLYSDLIDWLVRNNQWEEAFNVTERSKSRSFLDLLGTRLLESQPDVPLLAALDSVEKRMAALDEFLKTAELAPDDQVMKFAEMDSLYQTRKKMLIALAKANEELSSLLTVSPLRASDVTELLDPNVTLLEYFVSSRFYLIFVLSKSGGVRGYRGDVSNFKLYGSLLDFRNGLTVPGNTEYRVSSRVLFDYLIKPVESDLRTDRLIVVPFGKLHYIPFSALLDDKDRFLIDRFTLTYLPSASMMKFIGGKRKTVDLTKLNFFAVGNPASGLPNLASAEEEVQSIGSRFSQKEILLKSEATETAVKFDIGKFGIVHFACHGVFNLDDPARSALFLTKGGGEDGNLLMDEIFGLKLDQAQLVVLSACETGLSKIVQGDELIGLTRAFIYAGTPSLVASLWPVNDRSTTILMKNFYREFGSSDKPKALQKAQLELKETPGFAHPYYWSCFGMVGDWE